MRRIAKYLALSIGSVLIAAPFGIAGYEHLSGNSLPTVASLSPYTPADYTARGEQLLQDAQTHPQKAALLMQGALDSANEGLIIYPDSPALLALRADIYTQLVGTLPDAALFAAHDYTKAYQLGGDSTYGKKAAAAAVTIGNFDQAVILYTQLAAQNPDDAELLLELTQAQAKSGYLEDAISTLTTLIKTLPSSETETLIKERDSLVSLVAESSTTSSTTAHNIGGTALFSPPTTTTIPEALTLPGAKESYNTATNALSGEAIIPGNATTTTIYNTYVSATTPVYVAAVDGKTVVYIASKSNGSFTIATDNPTVESLSVKWYIK